MRRKIAAAFAALLLAVGLAVFATAGPALASAHPQTYGQCAIYNFCIWDGTSIEDYNFVERSAGNTPRNTCYSIAAVGSLINNDSQYNWYVSKNANCAGRVDTGTIALIWGYSGPTLLNSTWNNQIEGYWRTSSVYHCYC
jgi:hypothetical protein